ncbi:DUF2804 domain-containing protein [Clostridium sp.]|uniref:DUF2804 domain-containing protein n=1 Tax=Clostridium sp. TaxID=1506 RepID=UPI0028459858|nr:DUF2804 domain-containing protein [Clostridium sp.]MDR3595896.1 DUF2804 domain-containing protein [Clostridium sp.]
MQYEITNPSRLLDRHGELIQKGYAKSLILKYRRKDVKKRKLRLKEWDYYLIYNKDFAVALTVGSIPFSGFISASFIDFKKAQEKTKSVFSLFPIWRVKMPESSRVGDVIYQDSGVNVYFKHDNVERKLYMKMINFEEGSDLEVSIILKSEPKDSMVIATPFELDKKKFYYNQKIIGMRASGEVSYKGTIYKFSPDNSFGLLDWGRGVWPYVTNWYWSAGQGMVDDKVFGFNLGYGFGNTSAATENMIFCNGIANKLENVEFIIQKNKNDELDYMKPWVITSSDKRFEVDFVPIIDRNVNSSAIIVSTEQHQVFGKFTGRAVLDDGQVIELKDFLGFAEKVENKW